MERFFNRSAVMNSDCYVADYTEFRDGRGVVISDTATEDINYFHLRVNPDSGVEYLAVNLEEYPVFIRGIPNC